MLNSCGLTVYILDSLEVNVSRCVELWLDRYDASDL